MQNNHDNQSILRLCVQTEAVWLAIGKEHYYVELYFNFITTKKEKKRPFKLLDLLRNEKNIRKIK